MKKYILILISLIFIAIALFFIYRLFFSPERINIIGRTIETTFGFKNGVVEFYSCGKLIKRFLKVEKLTTAKGTYEKQTRPYRFGYGYLDENLNGILDKKEKEKGKVYFEIPSYRDYIYYDAKFIPEK